MTRPPLEKDFQARVLKRLRTLKRTHWAKLNDRTTIGLPDVVGCVAGRYVALELKTTSELSGLQAYTLKLIGFAGGVTHVVTPDNFDKVFDSISSLALEK